MRSMKLWATAAVLLAGGGVAAAAKLPRRLDGSGTGDEAPDPSITRDELLTIMPKLSVGNADLYLPHLNVAMYGAAILDTVDRSAAFLAQLAHESAELTKWVEEASGQAYEGRKILGNTYAGDGPRFKGRGPMQLTGRYNYTEAGKALGIDLVGNPDRAADVDVGFLVAAWYWTSRDLNPLADAGDFVEITRKINGGTNGLAQRQMYYARALAALAHRRAVA